MQLLAGPRRADPRGELEQPVQAGGAALGVAHHEQVGPRARASDHVDATMAIAGRRVSGRGASGQAARGRGRARSGVEEQVLERRCRSPRPRGAEPDRRPGSGRASLGRRHPAAAHLVRDVAAVHHLQPGRRGRRPGRPARPRRGRMCWIVRARCAPPSQGSSQAREGVRAGGRARRPGRPSKTHAVGQVEGGARRRRGRGDRRLQPRRRSRPRARRRCRSRVDEQPGRRLPLGREHRAGRDAPSCSAGEERR